MQKPRDTHPLVLQLLCSHSADAWNEIRMKKKYTSFSTGTQFFTYRLYFRQFLQGFNISASQTRQRGLLFSTIQSPVLSVMNRNNSLLNHVWNFALASSSLYITSLLFASFIILFRSNIFYLFYYEIES